MRKGLEPLHWRFFCVLLGGIAIVHLAARRLIEDAAREPIRQLDTTPLVRGGPLRVVAPYSEGSTSDVETRSR